MDALFSKDSILLGPEKIRSQALSACEADLLVQHLVGLVRDADGDAERRVRFRNLVLLVVAMNVPTRLKDLCRLRYGDVFDEDNRLRDYPATLNGIRQSEVIYAPFRPMVGKLLDLYRERMALHHKIHASRLLFECGGEELAPSLLWGTLARVTSGIGIAKAVGMNTPRNTFGAGIYEKAEDKLEAAVFREEAFIAQLEKQACASLMHYGAL